MQLACSRDIRLWKRLGDRRPFIDVSRLDSGAYDLATVIGPSSPVPHGDELWFYYTGLKRYGGPTPRRGVDRDQGAICLAVLRRDGFISVDAGQKPGILVTKPRSWSGRALHVNLDAPRGDLRVDALDGDGRVLAALAALIGDTTDGTVHWTSGSVDGLRGATVRLRFTLRQARLYSYWLA